MGKRRVTYFHDADTMGAYYYGPGHPMKPHRLQMTHNLILSYHLYRKMEVYGPHLATDEEMTQFHTPEYIDFIRRVTPDNQHDFAKSLQRFTVGDDCPVRYSHPAQCGSAACAVAVAMDACGSPHSRHLFPSLPAGFRRTLRLLPPLHGRLD